MTPQYREIITAPHPLLAQTAQAVEHVTDEVRTLLNDMVHTMHVGQGCGLAAPQIAIGQRLFVMDCTEDKSRIFKMINPTILKATEQTEMGTEGCLSIPGVYVDVERPTDITVEYIDEHGEKQQRELSGLEARCAQHELDHLNGILFIDYFSNLKRRILLKKSQKYSNTRAM